MKILSNSEYPYLYETHLHTCRSSKCANDTPTDMMKALKDAGYAGTFITEHNWGGNTCIRRDLPWKEWVHEFCKSYTIAKEWGDAHDFDVFFGYEAGFNGTEFLIYGIDEEWMIEHEELKDASIEEHHKLVHDAGGIVVHAHPYRKEWYIPEVVLCPEHIDAVEGINATHSNPRSISHNDPKFDECAIEYARKHGFMMTGGSDIHSTDLFGGGTAFKRRLTSAKDFCNAILAKEECIITNGVDWFDSISGEKVG